MKDLVPLLVDEKAIAERLGVTIRSTQRWRQEGSGPPWIRIGRLARYNPAAVAKWLEHQAVDASRGIPANRG